MKDILVTTPKIAGRNAAAEAAHAKANPGSIYFRVFKRRPHHLDAGSRIYYTEDGYIRGYAVVERIEHKVLTCAITGFAAEGSCRAIMQPSTWKWVKPYPYKPFRGWRYLNISRTLLPEVGDWLDPKPETQ